MLGPKDIQKECRETTQDAQEAESSNDPQEQYCLGVHAEICGERTEALCPRNTLRQAVYLEGSWFQSLSLWEPEVLGALYELLQPAAR